MSQHLLTLLHVLATVVWVGGMFFAHLCLRPAAVATLEPPQRLALWRGVFGRFFQWVWSAVILLIVTGMALLQSWGGGITTVPPHVHVMAGIGYLMAAIYGYIYFVPYASFKREVVAGDWTSAGATLNRIRVLVGSNLTLGLSNIALVFVLPVLGL